MIWLLSNTIDYSRDARQDLKIVHIFTVNGSIKEFPLLLKGFVSITGRDSHFMGDLNKMKSLCHENIRFLDLKNFFEDKSLMKLACDWIRSP